MGMSNIALRPKMAFFFFLIRLKKERMHMKGNVQSATKMVEGRFNQCW